MKHRNTLLGLAAAALLGVVSTAKAAPVLTMSVQVLTTANATIPIGTTVNGITHVAATAYTITPGTSFRVLVNGAISSPQSTDTDHKNGDGDPLPQLQLGMQNLVLNLNSQGTNGSIVPTTLLPVTSPPRWGQDTANNAASRATPSSLGFSFTNLIDNDGDGDLDPAGAGYANNTLSYSDALQAPSLQNGIGTAIGVVRGGYTASASIGGVSNLLTQVTSANYFDELPAADNNLAGVAFPIANIINGTATITVVVPEPATIGLAGLGLLGLLGARRRA